MIQPLKPGHPLAALHPPLTVLVLAPTAWAFGGDPLAMRLQMALLGAVVVFAVAYLARMVGGPRAGLYAGVVAAVYPNFWMNDGLLMSETLAALAVTVSLIALIALVHLVRSPGSWRSALVASLAGSRC